MLKDMRFKIIPLVVAILTAAVSAQSAVVDDARRMISEGQYSKALPLLQKELKAKPKDGVLNYLAAQCLMKMGDEKSALPMLRVAESRQVADASVILAEKAFGEYRFDEVAAHVDAYRRATAKSGKALPESLQSIQRRAQRAQSMLDRVERIVIIDSIAVNKDDFFKAYKLTSGAGALSPASTLPVASAAVGNSPVYRPESGACAYWAEKADGKSTLMTSSVLTDGTWEEPVSLAENLNEGGDAAYPFLLPDGVTLYFANNGENSIGGYDIFVSRKDEGKFLNPQNLGMPYNSIYDDYLLVIDEFAGVGWWATDRNRLGDKITIYRFIPSEVRNNYEADEDGIADRALARNYRATWPAGADYSALLSEIEALPGEDTAAAGSSRFRFAMPGGKVYTSLGDFANADARAMMQDYLEALADIESTKARLASLRRDYAAGNLLLADEILRQEKNLEVKRLAVKDMANEIVRTENQGAFY